MISSLKFYAIVPKWVFQTRAVCAGWNGLQINCCSAVHLRAIGLLGLECCAGELAHIDREDHQPVFLKLFG